MPNKAFDKLNALDQALRRACPVTGMDDNYTKCTIEMLNGFELFNTRQYHNYETWSDGYRIKNRDGSIVVEREDLDDAVNEFCAKVEAARKEKASAS